MDHVLNQGYHMSFDGLLWQREVNRQYKYTKFILYMNAHMYWVLILADEISLGNTSAETFKRNLCFSQKTGFDISCKLSRYEIICMRLLI